MGNGSIVQALKRFSERPDIHGTEVSKTSRKVGYSQAVIDRVKDLKENIEGISDRDISGLLKISRRTVAMMIGEVEPAEDWTEDDNPESAAAELAALHEHHPGRRYEDDEDALKESTAPVLFTAPAHRDLYRPADQSHTIKRPITLASEPFNVAA